MKEWRKTGKNDEKEEEEGSKEGIKWRKEGMKEGRKIEKMEVRKEWKKKVVTWSASPWIEVSIGTPLPCKWKGQQTRLCCSSESTRRHSFEGASYQGKYCQWPFLRITMKQIYFYSKTLETQQLDMFEHLRTPMSKYIINLFNIFTKSSP